MYDSGPSIESMNALPNGRVGTFLPHILPNLATFHLLVPALSQRTRAESVYTARAARASSLEPNLGLYKQLIPPPPTIFLPPHFRINSSHLSSCFLLL